MTGPVVVAGGGLAGAAAACRLAQAGCAVRVFEREGGPVDKICGEFLGPAAQRHLRALGLDPAALGGRPIGMMRLVRGARVAQAALPFQALGLSRRVLDEALLGHAAAAGAEVIRGAAVALAGDGDLALQTPYGVLRPETLFLATGKHELRGMSRELAAAPEALIGFKTYFALDPAQLRALDGAIEVILLPQGYAGLQLVEDGRANLCLLVRRDALQAAGGSWPGLLARLCEQVPQLRLRLGGAEELLARPLSIYRVPYGFVHRARASAPAGLFRLGDQVGVIPSFAGDGMGIALHSAAVAASMHLAGLGAVAYHRRIGREIGGQIGRTHALYRFARWPAGQALVMAAAQRWPGLLGRAAAVTRVPSDAVGRAAV